MQLLPRVASLALHLFAIMVWQETVRGANTTRGKRLYSVEKLAARHARQMVIVKLLKPGFHFVDMIAPRLFFSRVLNCRMIYNCTIV